MDLEGLSPRLVGALAVLALLPAVAFGIGKSDPYAAAVTMINVVLISASIYVFMSPHDGDDHESEQAA